MILRKFHQKVRSSDILMRLDILRKGADRAKYHTQHRQKSESSSVSDRCVTQKYDHICMQSCILPVSTNPPNHLQVVPWQYHSTTMVTEVNCSVSAAVVVVPQCKIKYSSKSLELSNSLKNGRKFLYCHCCCTTTATETV